eukprot:SAG22_NODE_1416_length_4469_cov_3.239930_1_plen_111_part_10
MPIGTPRSCPATIMGSVDLISDAPTFDRSVNRIVEQIVAPKTLTTGTTSVTGSAIGRIAMATIPEPKPATACTKPAVKKPTMTQNSFGLSCTNAGIQAATPPWFSAETSRP